MGVCSGVGTTFPSRVPDFILGFLERLFLLCGKTLSFRLSNFGLGLVYGYYGIICPSHFFVVSLSFNLWILITFLVSSNFCVGEPYLKMTGSL